MNDLKSKIKHTAQKAKDKFDETVTWCFEHPVETAAIAGFSLKVLGKVNNFAALNG